MFYIDIFARTLTVLVFLTAVAGKTRSRRAFAEFVASLRALGVPMSRVVAPAVVAGEAVVVVAMLAGVTSFAYAVAGLLLTSFVITIVHVVRTQRSVACHCFLSPGSSLGMSHVRRNSVFLTIVAVGAAAHVASVDALAPAGVLLAVALGAAAAGAFVRWEDLAFVLGSTPQKRA